MTEAFRLYDYRLFCTMCTAVCDVKGINEEDAVREAKRMKGWMGTDDLVNGPGLICPDDYWAQRHNTDPAHALSQEDPNAHDSSDAPGHPSASSHHQH